MIALLLFSFLVLPCKGSTVIAPLSSSPCFFQIDTFTEHIALPCDSTVLIPGLGYPTWNTPVIVLEPKHGAAILLGTGAFYDTLSYQPEAGFSGQDSVVVDCAHATQITCETGIYVFDVSCLNDAHILYPTQAPVLFPNPAKDHCFLRALPAGTNIRLFNAQGILVRKDITSSFQEIYRFNLQGLPPGIYALETSQNGIPLYTAILQIL